MISWRTLCVSLVVVLPAACSGSGSSVDASMSDALGRLEASSPHPDARDLDVPDGVGLDAGVDIPDVGFPAEGPGFPNDVYYPDLEDVRASTGADVHAPPDAVRDATPDAVASLDVQPSPDAVADAHAGDSAPPEDSGCPAGQRFCGGRCVDRAPSTPSCTPCGLPCCAGNRCNAGQCYAGCPAGWSQCPNPTPSPSCEGGICVPLLDDAQNCGRCGNACPSGQVCRSGVCAR